MASDCGAGRRPWRSGATFPGALRSVLQEAVVRHPYARFDYNLPEIYKKHLETTPNAQRKGTRSQGTVPSSEVENVASKVSWMKLRTDGSPGPSA